MAVTQEVVMNFLLEQGGKVRNSELLKKFKPLVDSPDPQEKATNRELFKTFVNSIAVVKDEEGGKFVVLRKKHWHLLAERQASPRDNGGEPMQGNGVPKEKRAHLLPATRDELQEAIPSAQKRRSSQQDLPGDQMEDPIHNKPEMQGESLGESAHATAELNDLNEFISADDSSKDRRESVTTIVARMDNAGPAPVPRGPPKESVQKPYMLPLRYPQASSASFDDTELDQDDKTYKENSAEKIATVAMIKPIQPSSPHVNRRQLDDIGSKSPFTKRSSKMLKVNEELKYSDEIPLESHEHEWLVKATSGRWNHRLHGLLLTDSELAEKRDFITGFTALHWAAKSGNSEMVKTLIDVAKKGGINLNVNVKSFGGYTPLHIAAIHDHKDVIYLLVMEYNAKVNLRDHSGRQPYQYLKKGSSQKIRILLNDPHSHTEQVIPIKRNSKVASSILGTTSAFLGAISDDIAVTDLAKGLKKPVSLNKFFPTASGQKKKIKVRDSYPSFSSLHQEIEDDAEAPVGKRRPVSEFPYH